MTNKKQQTSVLVGGDALINVIGMDASQTFPYKGANVLLCLLTGDITARTSSKKLRFEKRFFLGISKSKFHQHALSANHGIDRLMCDVMRQKQAFVHAFFFFFRVASVVVNHCIQIPKFLGRVSGNNVLLSIGKKNVIYWSQLASDYLTIITLGVAQLSGEKDLCQQGSIELTNVPTRAYLC